MSISSVSRQETVKFGVISRADVFGEGFRLGLLEAAAKIFNHFGVQFIIFAGGIVSKNGIYTQLKKRWDEKVDNSKRMSIAKQKLIIKKEFLEELTNQLGDIIPKVYRPETDQLAKWYLIDSPIYDGPDGSVIAKSLRIRRDIRHWPITEDGSRRFPLKRFNMAVDVLVPRKGVFLRGKYYHTAPERVLLDHSSQTLNRVRPQLIIIGCYGTHVFKPGGGDFPVYYLAVPACSQLTESRTGVENQIGVTIVEFENNNPAPVVFTVPLNDSISDERSLIKIPESFTPREVSIVRAIQRNGAHSVGVLADEIGLKRELVKEVISSISIKAPQNWPGLRIDDADLYDFDRDWIRNKLKYSCPALNKSGLITESFLALACLHAGSKYLDHKFAVDVIPQTILNNNIQMLIGAGDFIEGLEHDLILREVYGGFNYTTQEELAASIIGTIILKVFRSRAHAFIANHKKINEEKLMELFNQSLVKFFYISGNHCRWTIRRGFRELFIFRVTLLELLNLGIRRILNELNLKTYLDINEIIRSCVVDVAKTHKFISPFSKLQYEVLHPSLGRAGTTVRLQNSMRRAWGSNVVIIGNFHTAVDICVWDSILGQRAAYQIGTLKRKTEFEDGMDKMVDFGVTVSHIQSESKTKRIVATDTLYVTDPRPIEYLDQKMVFDTLTERFNIYTLDKIL